MSSGIEMILELLHSLADDDKVHSRKDHSSDADDPEVVDISVDGDEHKADRKDERKTQQAYKVFNVKKTIFAKKKTRGKGRWILLSIIAVLLMLAGLVWGLTTFITDLMWYTQLGFQSVLWTQVVAKIGVWALYAVLMAIFGYISAALAIRTRPDNTDGTRVTIHGNVVELGKGIHSKVAFHIAGVLALIAGIAFGSNFYTHWVQIVLMFHAQPFGITDPQFGIDNGFYVFVLPGLRLFTGAFIVLLLASLVFSIATHVVMGGIRLSLPVKGKGVVHVTKAARIQLAIWLMLVAIALAVSQILDMLTVVTQQGSRITGGGYTDIHAGVPASVAMAIAIVAAGVICATWLLRSHALAGQAPLSARFMGAVKAWRTPVIAVAILAVVAVVMGSIYPLLLQRFKVNPNAQELESTYIARNIQATKEAYGLTKVKKVAYQATSQGKSGALAKEAEATAQIRLLDPQVIAPTFRQLQQSKQYYTFADTLAVDKYDIDSVSQDTVIAARELNIAGNDNRNWVNDHTVYTHGYGIVAAYGNKVTADGQPKFMEYGIPTQGKLTEQQKYEPRIYFSPNAPAYSIVGAPEGAKPWEFDYPTGSSGALNTFKGNGGPSVGNWFSRLLHAIRFESDQILFSDRVTENSQILYDRDPKIRVSKVAPYLTLDGRVYPAVVDGRVKWIVDGYTTSDNYPYSQKLDLGKVTQDSTTTTSHSIKGLASQQANYIRNAVKATVDAYDGSVDLYVWDQHDPVIRAWRAIFPSHYHDMSDISADLMSHLRYPESLFKVQRHLLAKYHIDGAGQFFSGEDFWQTPVDPTEPQQAQREDILQPPYYLTLQTGGDKKPVFSLVSTYIPAGKSTREILTGFLSVNSDAGDKKGTVDPDYGTIRLQELPKDSNVPGPGQAQNNFNANANVSKELNLLESGSTKIKRGNLLTLPLGGGLVYVEPVYIQSSGATSFPLLKKVLVAFGDQVGFADTLDEALDQVFGGNSGAKAGDAANTRGNTKGEQHASTPDKPSAKEPSPTNNPELTAALKKAAQAMKDADSALQKHNWADYGKAQETLKNALEEAVSLQEQSTNK